ncbi:putative mitochondrial protein AtMg00860 [Nicotiana tabacum]|uniref:Mitochondrial protein AtMg00860 n=1 Tax=Nicotiana tabacum TaxID=4097 RepID=A0AC58RPK5_TOBAC
MPDNRSSAITVEYLGHYISAKGVATDPKKILVVQKWPTPTTLNQLRGFMELAGYCRRFIKGYGVISRLLTDLLKKDCFKWINEATHSFEELKRVLTSALVLALPNFDNPFIVETDACDMVLGVVLMLQGQPIAYLSKALSVKHLSSLYMTRNS